MLLMGFPRAKMGLVLLSISVNNPKEATLNVAFKWHSTHWAAGPSEGSPGALSLYQHLAHQELLPSATCFSLSLPHIRAFRCMLSERMKWSLQNNKDGKVSQLSPLGKQLNHKYSKDMFIPFDQRIFLGIHPTELSLKHQKATYV